MPDKATFTAGGIGSKRAWCTSIEFGFKVVAGSSVTRNATTIIPKEVTSGSWQMTVEFATTAEWRSFAEWLDKYLDLARMGLATSMAVEVSDANFSRHGVLLSGGYSHGETFDQTKMTETLAFESTQANMGAYTKEPVVPLATQGFYPTTSEDTVESSLYDKATKGQSWLEKMTGRVPGRITAEPATPATPIRRDTGGQ